MMNRQEFITALRKALSGLPQEDAEKSIAFYDEMISDRIEDGAAEEEAVAAVGSVEETARQILSDVPLAKIVKAKVKPNRSMKIWKIVLIILGSPVWLSLAAAAIAVLLSVYVVIWAVIVSLYCVDIAFALSGIACAVGAFIYAYELPAGISASVLFFGAGLICAGISIVLFPGFNRATRCILLFSGKIMTGVKSMFIKKRGGI